MIYVLYMLIESIVQNWVTSYSLTYSNDTNIWFYYKDANHLEAKVAGQSSTYVRT